MHRQDDDVFQPAASVSTKNQAHPGSLEPDPGPTASWTARGVIDALQPLTTETRRQRLGEIVSGRIAGVTLVFDHPHDPHNGSAVLRSCDAFGVQRIHVVCGHEDFAASRMVSKGSERWVDVVAHENPKVVAQLLHDQGFRLLVTHPEGRLTPSDLRHEQRVALILGNERDGVSESLRALADDTIRIPMRGFVESLNVSVTAGILVQAACEGRKSDLTPAQRENIYARWLRKSVPRADEVLLAMDPC